MDTIKPRRYPAPRMPFKSARQRRYLYAKKPAVARKFAKHSKRKKRGKK